MWNPLWWYPPLGTPINSWTLYQRILQQISRWHQQQPFDLIDAHFGFPEGIAAAMLARKLNIPFVITQRGHEPLVAERKTGNAALRWALKSASHVISVSDELTEFAITMGVSPDQTTTVTNGVNANIFRQYPKSETRNKVGISPEAFMILSVGYLVPRKGHLRVIQALNRVIHQNPEKEIQLVIVGGESTHGGYTATLRRTVKKLGLEKNVQFLAPLPETEIAKLMSDGDVLCLASDWEGCPNVVVEALACGTPVVASHVGQIPTLIQEGVNGYTFAPASLDEFTEKLSLTIAQVWDRDEIARRGQFRTWDIVAKEVGHVFQKVVANNF